MKDSFTTHTCRWRDARPWTTLHSLPELSADRRPRMGLTSRMRACHRIIHSAGKQTLGNSSGYPSTYTTNERDLYQCRSNTTSLSAILRRRGPPTSALLASRDVGWLVDFIPSQSTCQLRPDVQVPGAHYTAEGMLMLTSLN